VGVTALIAAPLNVVAARSFTEVVDTHTSPRCQHSQDLRQPHLGVGPVVT
jgi:hypothetical protein